MVIVLHIYYNLSICMYIYSYVSMYTRRAVRYHPKYAYHDTIALVSRYIVGIDTLHDMAYMT